MKANLMIISFLIFPLATFNIYAAPSCQELSKTIYNAALDANNKFVPANEKYEWEDKNWLIKNYGMPEINKKTTVGNTISTWKCLKGTNLGGTFSVEIKPNGIQKISATQCTTKNSCDSESLARVGDEWRGMGSCRIST